MQNMSWVNALKTTSLQEAMGMTDKAYHKWLKQQAKKYGTYALKDKLTHSMQEGTLYERFRADRDGEGWSYYGFVMGEQFADYYDVDSTFELTDAEIQEWFDEIMRVEIYSDYDCTGKAFTEYISWHRNPNGAISYVHKMAVDV